MTAHRLSQKPLGYVAPVALPLVELRAVLPLVPRLRCGACAGRVAVEPPSLLPGRLYCRDCGRDYNEVVDRLPERVVLTEEEMHPKRGRPPSGGRPPMSLREGATPGARLCEDCHVRRCGIRRRRCGPCGRRWEDARQETLTLRCELLVAALRSGPRVSAQLAVELDVPVDYVRSLSRVARVRGYPIETRGRAFRLAGVAS